MHVYHGSNMRVERPRLILQNRFLDFGFGFYTTSNRSQAENFSGRVARRERAGIATVNAYSVDEEKLRGLSILSFDSPNEEWLDFVSANRNGTYSGQQHDLVFGPVANDDVYETFLAYSSGILSREQAIKALSVRKLYNQYLWASDKALACLSFIESYTVEGPHGQQR